MSISKSVFLLLFLIPFSIHSQTIPSNRLVNWSAGLDLFQFNDSFPITDVSSLGVDATGNTSSDLAINSFIQSVDTSVGAVLLFPAGTYSFNNPLILKSNIILRGVSTDSVIFKFDLAGSRDCIIANGTLISTNYYTTASAIKGNNYILLSSGHGILAGDFLKISDNDSSVVTSSWALGSTGQMMHVLSVAGDTVFFDNELRRNFPLSRLPKVQRVLPKYNMGIENIKIERLDATSSQTSNINFNYVNNCKISCINSLKCNFSHVECNYSNRIQITGSYFQDAFAYGGGGQGYGVVLHFTTGEAYVYNNVFNHLRHSVLLQAGSNGNVIAYNYSRNPFWSEALLPSNSAGDLVLHGNYVYHNLFEGNICQNIVVDNSHGINGPNNTFFRNRAELYGIFMNSGAGDSTIFVSNEVTNTGFLLGLYTLTGNANYTYGNNIKGTLNPAGSNAATSPSLYLSQAPGFYLQQSSWPPIGSVGQFNLYTNASKYRYTNSRFTDCENSIAVPLDVVKNEGQIYPNPCLDKLYFKSNTEYDNFFLVSVDGKFFKLNDILYSGLHELDLSFVPRGLYFLVAQSNDGLKTILDKIVKI